MKKKHAKNSLKRKLLLSIVFILAASSFFATFIVFNVLPVSSDMFNSIDPKIRVEAVRVFRIYTQLSMAFAFILSAVIISINISRTLNPIRALTEGANKVAGGDFEVSIPVDLSKQDELTKLTDSFNKMARELSLINMLNNDFINNVSHEFKTPISSIQGFATVMLGTSLTAEQREYAEIIVHESERLTKLITNILRLSKLENQEIITEKEGFYIDEQIRRSYLLFQNELARKNIDIDLELSQIAYTGNPDLIQQIWHNLLGNAIKFSYRGGLITIRCYAVDKKAVVSVKDGGIGMDKTTASHIYDKFFQGDRSHVGDGNGLGLSLVKRIVELCGGTIDVESGPGKGSKFTVALPLMD